MTWMRDTPALMCYRFKDPFSFGSIDFDVRKPFHLVTRISGGIIGIGCRPYHKG